MSTSATSNPAFSGQSQFAASLQQVITRAVGIAPLPLQTDQVTLNSLDSRQTDLQSLDTDFSNVQSSLAAIQTALTSGSLTSSVSDGSVVSEIQPFVNPFAPDQETTAHAERPHRLNAGHLAVDHVR